MQIIDFTEAHAEQAMRLAQAAYDAERVRVPALPDMHVPDLRPFAKNNLGAAAFEGDAMTGFLCAKGPFKKAFGTNRDKLIFSPAHANAALGDRARVYHRLYQAAAQKWVNAGALTHAVTLYAHDEPAKQAWFEYGFGMRCIDAIKLLETDAAVPEGDFIELPRERFGEIQDLRLALNRCMGESPYFMKERFSPARDVRIFVARQNDQFVAHMTVRGRGEHFASCAPGMMNIAGAYAVPDVRGTGLYANLLRYVEAILAKEGYTRLGVDYESFNPAALYFYPKHFSVYTNSLVRRIDERGNR